MPDGFMFFFNSVLLGIGLAIDAFSVSLANGLNEPDMRAAKMCAVAGVFGVFQALMPLVGWTCVHTIVEKFREFEKAIPWIALALLGYIGGKTLISGIKNKDRDEHTAKTVGIAALLLQGVATSIDALSVGFTIADYDFLHALTSALIIALVTFIISLAGILIGKRFGTKLTHEAEILGGIILIAIGVEVFLEAVL